VNSIAGLSFLGKNFPVVKFYNEMKRILDIVSSYRYEDPETIWFVSHQRRNSTETQQLGHTPRSGAVYRELTSPFKMAPGPEVKNGRSSAKDGVPERLGCGIVKEEVSHILQRVSTSAARRILLWFYLA